MAAADPFTKPEPQARMAYRERELAEALGVSIRTLFDWRRQGLPFVSVNGRPLYMRESVTEWLKARETREVAR